MFREERSSETGIQRPIKDGITQSQPKFPDREQQGAPDDLIARVCAELDHRRVPYLLGDVTNFVTVSHATCRSPELLADRFEALSGAGSAAAKDCPRCGLVNSPNAMRCDCGWDFVTRRQEQSYLYAKQRGAAVGMGAGLVVLIIILIRLLIALIRSFANGQ